MAKFRKKPVVIEAMQFNGDENLVKILDWIDTKYKPCGDDSVLIIETLEGDMKAQKCDWVIKGVNGEFYPCKPDIFEKTYEPA